MKIKKNDTVLVIAGNYKGKTGKVLKVFRDTNKVIVEGVNIVKRHSKPTQKVPQGGIIQKEAPIHVSNVMLVDPKTNEPTRVGGVILKDEATGKKRKMRIGVKSKEMFE
ncbi:MAG TPA: 50S ribosomal protein L24 [Bacteroidota bacterium]|jgi:large subunit ribosomal protein L24|nr:50S ribosomal protein L24 [Bacteroidota bacterium]